METYRIEILNPKAKKLLKNLVDLDLITMSKSVNNEKELEATLSKLRLNEDFVPDFNEITKEVENVRKMRYATKKKEDNH